MWLNSFKDTIELNREYSILHYTYLRVYQACHIIQSNHLRSTFKIFYLKIKVLLYEYDKHIDEIESWLALV